MTEESFGRYEVRGEIGDGAMGRVYRGFDPLADRDVAIKTIRPDLLTGPGGDAYRARFQREARAVARLGHPAIVTIFDVGESYFVMELLEGETLQGLLSRRGRLPLAEALKLLAPLADALDYAHEHGIVHRDIKPANILVQQRSGRPKIMDFGIVHVEQNTMTSAGQMVGSPQYMAPEQVRGTEITGKVDQFALGLIAYEALSGHAAFDAPTVMGVLDQVVNHTPPPPSRWNPELPAYCDDVLARAMAKDPAARYDVAMDFMRALWNREAEDAAPRPVTVPVASVAAPPRPVTAVERTQDDAGSATIAFGRAPGPPPSAGRRRVRPAFFGILAAAAAAGWLASRYTLPAGRGVPEAPPASAAPTLTTAAPRPSAPATPPPLAVESEPAGATVYVDSGERGVTPIAIEGLAAGDHTVRLTKDGFGSAELAVSFGAEGHPPLRFVLSALPVPRATATAAPTPTRAKGKVTPRTAVTAAPTSTPTDAPARPGDLVALGPGVTPPRKISGRTASYPSAALAKKLQGTVTVDLLVDENGAPQDLKVAQTVGAVLDDAVLAAIRTWRYEPAVKDGVKVKVRIRESQSFELRQK